MKLKPHTFWVGTWNANRQGSCSSSGSVVDKAACAAGMLCVEALDLLVVTETHSAPLFPGGVTVLGYSGVSDVSAGVAVLSKGDGGWLSLDSVELVPGHTFFFFFNHPILLC